MNRWVQKQAGFTIVELLIVIVVIAILATITIVAYNGIRDRAKASALQSAIVQANKKIMTYAATHNDQYPATLADAEVSNANGITYEFSVNTSATPNTYGLTATIDDATSYFMSNTGGSAQLGTYPGHNLIPWNESAATIPVIGASYATDVYRSAPASVRLAPGVVGIPLRYDRFNVVTGQLVTVRLWVKTSANWNGTGNNSKIRFGDQSGSNILSCVIGGPKIDWTLMTCGYTVTSGVTLLRVTLGNDGTVGDVWFDDITLTSSL